MNARDDILSSIRSRTRPKADKPEPYRAPTVNSNLITTFAEKAQAANAEIRILEGEAEIPEAIADVLRSHNLAARLHMPPLSDIANMDWRMDIQHSLPGPDDATVTRAPLAIAETGTLVQPARHASPASWHFRPGFEITILRESDIVAHFEDAIAKLKNQNLPMTINLITGPSRTGDIEQTLELGAHGPKALAILIIRD
jgi:L-lactate dehydrogenase complex protein LldG